MIVRLMALLVGAAVLCVACDGQGSTLNPQVSLQDVDYRNPNNYQESEIEYHSDESGFATRDVTAKKTALANAHFHEDDYKLVIVDGSFAPLENLPGGLYTEVVMDDSGVRIDLFTESECETNGFSFLLDVDENTLGLDKVTVGPAAGGDEQATSIGYHVDEGIYNYAIASKQNLGAGLIGSVHLIKGLHVASVINAKHEINKPDIFDITVHSPTDGCVRWEEFNLGDANNDGTVNPEDMVTLLSPMIHDEISNNNDPQPSLLYRRYDDFHRYFDYTSILADALPGSDWIEDNLVFVDPVYPNYPSLSDSAVFHDPDFQDATITSYIVYVKEESRIGVPWAGVYVPLAEAVSWQVPQFTDDPGIPVETQPWHPNNPKSIFHCHRNEARRTLNYTFLQDSLWVSGKVGFRVWFPGDPMLPPFYSVDISDVPYLFGEKTTDLVSGQQRRFTFRVRPIAVGAPLGAGEDGTNSEQSNEYLYDIEGPDFMGIVNKANEEVGPGGAIIKWRHVNDLSYRHDPVSYILRYCQGDYRGDQTGFEQQVPTEIPLSLDDLAYMPPHRAYFLYGLVPSQYYSFQVRAVDDWGNMSDSPESLAIQSFPAAVNDSVTPVSVTTSTFAAEALVTPAGHVELTIRNYQDGVLYDGDANTKLLYELHDGITSSLLTTLDPGNDALLKYYETTVSLNVNTHYDLYIVAKDSHGNLADPSNVVQVFTWDMVDTASPYAWQSPMIESTNMTHERREVNLVCYAPIDQSEMTVSALYSTAEPLPGMLQDWILDCEANNRVLIADEPLTNTTMGGKTSISITVPEGGVEYYMLLGFDDGINPKTYDIEVLPGVGNVLGRIPVSIAATGAGTLQSVSYDIEACTGRWFDQDAMGNLAVLFTAGSRLCVGYYDTLTGIFLSEEIECETEGPVFCDGRASLAFDANGRLGVAYVAIEGFSPAPVITEGMSTSSVRQEKSVSTNSVVKYTWRSDPGLTNPGGATWDDPVDVVQMTASNLHVSFVQPTSGGSRTIPVVAGSVFVDGSMSARIWRKNDNGDFFQRKAMFPGSTIKGQSVDQAGLTRLLLYNMDLMMISGDATGANWLPIYAGNPSSYAPAPSNLIGLFKYGLDRDLVFFNGYNFTPQYPDVGVVQTLSVDRYVDFSGFSLPDYSLAGMCASGTAVSDLGLVFIGPIVEDNAHRDVVFHHVNGQDQLGFQFGLPGGRFMQMNDYPLAVGYSEATLDPTIIVCYTDSTGIVLMSSQAQ